VKGKSSAWTNQLRQTAQNSNGISNKLQYETTDGGIKRFCTPHLGNIALGETHMVQSGLGDANPSSGDRARVAFHSHDLSRRANQPTNEHSHVPGA